MSTATSNTRPLATRTSLPLRLPELIVQAAQHAALRAGVVVLHEVGLEAGHFGKGAGIEAFHEEAARIAEHPGLEDQQLGNGCTNDLHQNTLVLEQPLQVPPVTVLGKRRREALQLRLVDPARAPGDLFRTRDLESLPFLDGLDEQPASSRLSCVPVSSQACPRPMTCTSSSPHSRYWRFRSVISSSPRGWA